MYINNTYIYDFKALMAPLLTYLQTVAGSEIKSHISIIEEAAIDVLYDDDDELIFSEDGNMSEFSALERQLHDDEIVNHAAYSRVELVFDDIDEIGTCNNAETTHTAHYPDHGEIHPATFLTITLMSLLLVLSIMLLNS